MAHFVYILYSPSLKQFYKGQTSDLDDRVKRHNAGYESATQSGCPWLLLWHTAKENRSQAIILEAKLKNLSRERLIAFMLKYPSPASSPDELLLLKQLSGC
jgi:putative endonuclease